MREYKKSDHLPETYMIGFFLVTSVPRLHRGYYHFRAVDSRNRIRVCTHEDWGQISQGDYLVLEGRVISDDGGLLLQVRERGFCQRYVHRRQFYQLYDHIAIGVNNLRNKLQTQDQIDLTRKEKESE